MHILKHSAEAPPPKSLWSIECDPQPRRVHPSGGGAEGAAAHDQHIEPFCCQVCGLRSS